MNEIVEAKDALNQAGELAREADEFLSILQQYPRAVFLALLVWLWFSRKKVLKFVESLRAANRIVFALVAVWLSTVAVALWSRALGAWGLSISFGIGALCFLILESLIPPKDAQSLRVLMEKLEEALSKEKPPS